MTIYTAHEELLHMTTDSHERLAKLEEKLKENFLEIEKRLVTLESKPLDFESRVNEVEDLQMLAQLDIVKIKQKEEDQSISLAIEEKLTHIAERVDDVEAKLSRSDGLGANLSKMEQYKREMDQLKTELNEVVLRKESVLKKSLDADLQLDKVNSVFAKIRALDDKTSVESEKISSFEEKTKLKLEQLESLRESLDAKTAQIDEKIKRIDAFLGEGTSGMEEESVQRITLEKNLQDLSRKFEELSSSVNAKELNRVAEEDYVTVVTLEKKLQDIIAKMPSVPGSVGVTDRSSEDFAVKLSEIESSVESLSKRIDQGPSDLTQRLSALETRLNATSPTADSMLLEARSKFQAEAEEKIAQFSSRIDEYAMKMQLEKEQMTKTLNMEELLKIRGEVINHNRMLRDIERNLEISAVRFFSENLEEFAKEVDKRLPQVVTREEFLKELKMVDMRLKKVNPAEVSLVEQRLMEMERKIGDIYAVTRILSAQRPIIVE